MVTSKKAEIEDAKQKLQEQKILNNDMQQDFNKKQRMFADKEKDLEMQIKEINQVLAVSNEKHATAIKQAENHHQQLAKLEADAKAAKGHLDEVYGRLGLYTTAIDRIMIRIREFLKLVYGPEFDKEYINAREANPSKEDKVLLVLPMLEVALLTFFSHQASTQGNQINIMQLTRNFSKHLRSAFGSQGITFEAKGVSSLSKAEQISQVLQEIYQPSQYADPVTIRLMFIPYSPGTYIALILDQETNIRSWINSDQSESCKLVNAKAFFDSVKLQSMGGSLEESKENSSLQQSQQAIEQVLERKESSGVSSNASSTSITVKKMTLENKLFLDINNLTKNMQVLLKTYEMFVVAQVRHISEHVSSGDPKHDMGLKEGTSYFKCQIEKVEHILNFTANILNKNKHEDYTFTDYIFQ